MLFLCFFWSPALVYDDHTQFISAG